MSLEKQLLEDMNKALKAGDKVRLETIRGLRAQLKNAQIAKGDNLSEEEIVQVLSGAAKKRRESIEQFRAVGRSDRADTEQQELEIIQTYLPKQLSEDEIREIITSVFEKVQPTSMKDMGRIMGVLMPRVKGRADGKLVQQIVKEKLAGL